MHIQAAGALTNLQTAELVVIIPTYRHPVLLTEALDSVLSQLTTIPLAVIVCSDGCPLPETDTAVFAFALSDPRIIYLRKPNGGPSSARNLAIDFALARFPGMRAVFFLDSDNRLTPTALQTGYDALLERPGTGWVYSHIDSFGVEWTANYGVLYSAMLHVIYDNFCDTGSFVRREILENGVRFDEDARSGYEDWDFWLQCVAKGFRGRHVPFGFSYRQRPESRFREMNRLRGAVLERLRQRHWSIAAPRTLLGWEHETNPRYLLTDPDEAGHVAFTDPTARTTKWTGEAFAAGLWGALSAGDEIWTPAFYVFGRAAVVDELARLGLAHGIFLLLERAARKCAFAALTLGQVAGEIAVETGPAGDFASIAGRAVLWVCTGHQLREMLAGDLTSGAPAPAVTDVPAVAEIHLHAAFADAVMASLPDRAPAAAMLATISAWRGSAWRHPDPPRWIWRPRVLPSRDEYYGHLCQYLGTSELMPRLAGEALNIGLLVPIASYGGSEKVGYALAQVLRRRGGARLHLFVIGAARMKLLSEYADAFDTVNFLADPAFPVWGGPVTVFGQGCFMPDAPEIKVAQMTGFLGGLDLVINCQSAPANSVMGAMRRLKTRTISYLHLTDVSAHGRPAGHSYIALGFEHAYDLIVTCSRALADELHALGIPSDKIQPIANAASFRITPETRERARAARAAPRGERKLRCLYIGRLDRQKGVERLLGCILLLHSRNLPVELRIVGSSIVDASGIDWAAKFRALGVALEAPIYATEGLIEAYLWADVLLLPSRWEGAPLVIPECQQLGCIPLCTEVGAVAELIEHDRDGLLVASTDDAVTAEHMAAAVQRLVEDDACRCRIAAAAIRRGETNRWESNFAPLLAWIDRTVRSRPAPPAAAPATAPS